MPRTLRARHSPQVQALVDMICVKWDTGLRCLFFARGGTDCPHKSPRDFEALNLGPAIPILWSAGLKKDR
jgi:hypothetical protein